MPGPPAQPGSSEPDLDPVRRPGRLHHSDPRRADARGAERRANPVRVRRMGGNQQSSGRLRIKQEQLERRVDALGNSDGGTEVLLI